MNKNKLWTRSKNDLKKKNTPFYKSFQITEDLLILYILKKKTEGNLEVHNLFYLKAPFDIYRAVINQE